MAKPNPKARKNVQPRTMSQKVTSHKTGLNASRITALEKEVRDVKIALAELRVECKAFLPQDDVEETEEIEEFEVEDRQCNTCSELDMSDKNCAFHVDKGAGFPCKKWKPIVEEDGKV